MQNPLGDFPYALPKIDTSKAINFIPEAKIFEQLEQADADPVRVRDIIAKALDKQRLDPEEMATLIAADTPELTEEIFAAARELKMRVYGNRIVLFAPLYVGSDCINDCKYCGFRCSNKQAGRDTLSFDRLKDEIHALVDGGHKRLIMVYGEHPKYSPEFIAETVRTVYSQKFGNGEIRRVNINAAPLDVEGFRTVKASGIGTYQVFQETYHQPTYADMHPTGPKSNYLWRLSAFDRAMEAGIDDVGIGALMGLADWRFETMSLLYHTIHLEDHFNVGPHTISFPRIEPAIGTGFNENPPNAVSDHDFKRLVAILRLSVPYTGLILTCRESVELRNEVLQFGVSQIDAGSSIGIGAYAAKDEDTHRKSQFELADNRSLDEVIRELCEVDFIPSFCTGCYRLGRTGEHFMEFAVPGFVKRYCSPNAILTFQEFLEDYASPETLKVGNRQIDREVARLNDTQRPGVAERLARVRNGERDLYF
ncbi:MAG: [FeFe] hydrogenase H-cluster radical SAM maturase HydG [Lentisphaeria bacterium]|nr:[FeFe] hydrogenase H-cluster radical SAM maturase HydG [Lentisphaeria bacterium]